VPAKNPNPERNRRKAIRGGQGAGHRRKGEREGGSKKRSIHNKLANQTPERTELSTSEKGLRQSGRGLQ